MEHQGRAIGRLLAVATTLAVTPALSVTLAAPGGGHPSVGSAASAYLAGLGAEAQVVAPPGTNDDPHGAFDS